MFGKSLLSPLKSFVFIEAHRIERGLDLKSPDTTLAFKKGWAEEFGGKEGLKVLFMPDEGMKPLLVKEDAVLVQMGCEEVAEGKIYLIRITDTGQAVVRRLADRGDSFYIFGDNPTLSHPFK